MGSDLPDRAPWDEVERLYQQKRKKNMEIRAYANLQQVNKIRERGKQINKIQMDIEKYQTKIQMDIEKYQTKMQMDIEKYQTKIRVAEKERQELIEEEISQRE